MSVMYGDALVINGAAYYFSNDKKTQDDAERVCADKHPYGRLAEITDRTDMSELMAVAHQKDFGSNNDFYLGNTIYYSVLYLLW